MPNQWARSCQLVCFNKDPITALTVIKAEYIPTNVYLEIYVTS